MQVLQRGDFQQKLRLVSGLVLFTFALTHFLNHALGLVHVETMHEFQGWRTFVTRSWPGTIVLGAALVMHILLALWKLANRTTWWLQPWELIQIALGLAIPFFLFPHIVNTRVANWGYGVDDNYLYELARLWPASALVQSTLLVLVWVHGCIGIHFWLRLHSVYRAMWPVLLFLAITIPLAALAGFMVSGRAVAQLIEDPAMLERIKTLTRWPNAADGEALNRLRMMVRIGFYALVAVFALAAAWRVLSIRTGPKVAITFAGGPTVRIAKGPSLLEISRMSRIAHAAVCGGRARCSTCRVRIDEGFEGLPPPKFPEAFTLASINAPPNVRLACQVYPERPMTVTRLLRPASAGPQSVDIKETDAAGSEKPLAVMFLDMRGFTRLSQNRLPYDVVFLLNEFFAATGAAITSHGGWIDKFLGDGLLAIFGRDGGIEAGCRQALRAARDIDLALDHVNAKLQAEIGQALTVGIGIDAGPLLIGRIGYGETIDLTVIGSAVNVASRLEALSKEKGCQIMLSRRVARHAGWDADGQFSATVDVRGVNEPVEVVGVARGRDLPAAILATVSGEDDSYRGNRGASQNRRVDS
jgi:adenylate cyclase